VLEHVAARLVVHPGLEGEPVLQRLRAHGGRAALISSTSRLTLGRVARALIEDAVVALGLLLVAVMDVGHLLGREMAEVHGQAGEWPDAGGDEGTLRRAPFRHSRVGAAGDGRLRQCTMDAQPTCFITRRSP
jgi:hypothetical protein